MPTFDEMLQSVRANDTTETPPAQSGGFAYLLKSAQNLPDPSPEAMAEANDFLEKYVPPNMFAPKPQWTPQQHAQTVNELYGTRPGNAMDAARSATANIIRGMAPAQSDTDYLDWLQEQAVTEEGFRAALDNGLMPPELKIALAPLTPTQRIEYLGGELVRRAHLAGNIETAANAVAPTPHSVPDDWLGWLAYKAGELAPHAAQMAAERALFKSPLGWSALNTLRGSNAAREQVYQNMRAGGADVPAALEAADAPVGKAADAATRFAASLATMGALGKAPALGGAMSPVAQTIRNIAAGSLASGVGGAAGSAITDARSGQSVDAQRALEAGAESAATTAIYGAAGALMRGRQIIEQQRAHKDLNAHVTRHNEAVTKRGFTPVTKDFSLQDSGEQIANAVRGGMISRADARAMLAEAGYPDDMVTSLLQGAAREARLGDGVKGIEAPQRAGALTANATPRKPGFSEMLAGVRMAESPHPPVSPHAGTGSPKMGEVGAPEPASEPDKKWGLAEGYTVEGAPERAQTLKGAKQHQFVLRNGKKDWGQVTEALTHGDPNIPVGPVRVQVGQRGWGLRHIKQDHTRDALASYNSVEDFIAHIMDDKNEIIPLGMDARGRKSEFLVVRNDGADRHDAAVIVWDDKGFYTLKSAYSPKSKYIDERRALPSGSPLPTPTPATAPLASNTAGTGHGGDVRSHYGDSATGQMIPHVATSAQEGQKDAGGKGSMTAKVRTAAGTEVDVRYRVRSADDLITSHAKTGAENGAYPQELQPRQRNREASQRQISDIANNLDPELLGENRLASDGAPVVGADGVVESGNGRVTAIRKAYQSGKADRYSAWMRENAAKFGLSEADFEGVNNPVLVRERVSDVDRAKFAREANESSVARMSRAEQAMADAKRITPEMAASFDPEHSVRANHDFIEAFGHDVIGKNEIGGFMDSEGRLSQEGEQRVTNALFALAYEDADVMNRVAESLDNEVKTVTNAMIAAAPKIAAMENAIEAGGLQGDLSIKKDVVEALKTLESIRAEGGTVENYLAQGMMFEDAKISPEARALLNLFNKNRRSAKKITEVLTRYAELARADGSPNQGRLFGEDEAPRRSKRDILRQALEERVKSKTENSIPQSLPQTREAIKKEYKRQIEAAHESYDEETAEAVTAVLMEGMESEAKSRGISVEDVARDWGLEIVSDPEGEGMRTTGDKDLDVLLQSMYHGTRHVLEGRRFKLSKIGTGEGAQVYGWGLYFAENRAVSESYRTAGGRRTSGPGNLYTVEGPENDVLLDWDAPISDQIDKVKELINDPLLKEGRKIKRELNKDVKKFIEKVGTGSYIEKAIKEAIKGDWTMWSNLTKAFWDDIPLLIAARLTGNEDISPLDIDKETERKIWAQVKEFEKEIEALANRKKGAKLLPSGSPKTGKDMYIMLGQLLAPGKEKTECFKAASMWLKEHGVVGLRYLDQGSRAAGEGTRNFVIWDEDTLKVMDVEGPAADAAETYMQRGRGQETRKAPNGEDSNLSAKQHTEVRTPNFRRTFGNWDYDPNTEVNVTSISGTELGIDFKDTAALKNWLIERYAGQTVEIESDGSIIGFTKKNLGASLKRRGEAQRSAYAALDALIRNAVYFDTEGNDGQAKHRTLAGQDVYYSALRIGDQLYSVKFKFDVAKGTLDQTYKDHKVTEIDVSPLVYHTVEQEGTSSKPYARTGDTTVTISDLTGGVKPKPATKVVDENGEPKPVYHGTSRADRVGSIFRPDRATSGPMAFFTDDRKIGEGYAKGKVDTSISYDADYASYETQFRVQDGVKTIQIADAWNRLSMQDRVKLRDAVRHVTWDENMENIIYDPDVKNGTGGLLEHVFRERKGNAIAAFIDEWLNSGNLYNQEEKFLEALKLAGITDALKRAGLGEVKYMDPSYREEKVYAVYLNIRNPFNAATQVTEDFVRGFEEWYNEQEPHKYDRATADVDLWDKNSVSVEDFADRMRRDIENGTSRAWTSIPDSMTDYLKSLGYDGIQDTGGKNGGVEHTVWIPFYSEQVKSATDNRGTFDPNNPDIYKQSLGERGAARLDASDAGRRMDDLNVAREMEKAGKDERLIKRATGWERGTDGKWRYEILDGEVREDFKFEGDETTLGELFDAPELYKAYPELKSIGVDFSQSDSVDGVYHASLEHISLSQRFIEYSDVEARIREIEATPEYKEFQEADKRLYTGKSTDVVKDEQIAQRFFDSDLGKELNSLKRPGVKGRKVSVNNKVKGVLIHEIQHAIQRKEGFARGGSPTQFGQGGDVDVGRYTWRQRREHADRLFNALTPEQQKRFIDVEHEVQSTWWKDRPALLERMLPAEERKLFQQWQDAERASENAASGWERTTPNEAYRRLAGETEARNASKRMNMSAEERRATLLAETEDVSREDQIILREALGVSESREADPDAKAYTRIEEARTIIGILKNADKSSLIHETGHVFLERLRRMAQMEGTPQDVKDDWKVIQDWLHIRDIDFTKELSENDKKRWRNAHEKFAAGFEKYLATGKAPNSRLVQIFEAFKKWLRGIYGDIRNITYMDTDGNERHFNLSRDVRELMDRMVGETDLDADMDTEATPEWEYPELSQNATEAVDGWLEQWERYDIQNVDNKSVQDTANIIKENGGLRFGDFVRTMGKDAAQDIRGKWPGLFRNTTGNKALSLDVMAERLGMDTDGLTQWLQSRDARAPKRPAPLIEVNVDTTNALIDRLGIEGAREYMDERARYLRGLQKDLQARYDMDKTDAARADLEATYKEQREIRKSIEALDRTMTAPNPDRDMTENERMGLPEGVSDAAEPEVREKKRPAQEQTLTLYEAMKHGYQMAERASREGFRAGKKEGRQEERARSAEKAEKLKAELKERIDRTREQGKERLTRQKNKLQEFYRNWVQRTREQGQARTERAKQEGRDRIERLKERLNIKERNAAEKRESNRLVKNIEHMAADEKVSWSKRQEIHELVEGYDLKKRTKKGRERIKDAETFLKAYPGHTEGLTKGELRRLGRIGRESMTLEDLRDLRKRVRKLHEEGRAEYEQWAKEKSERVEEARLAMRGELEKRPVEKPKVTRGREDRGKQYRGLRGWGARIKDWTYAATLNRDRFFDWLDGGRTKYNGAFTKYFVEGLNDAYNKGAKHTQDRKAWMERELGKLGFKMSDFASIATEIDGVPYTWSKIMEIYMGMKNEKKAEAILYGNFVNEGSYTAEEAQGVIEKLLGTLTDKHRAAAELVAKDHETHFDRLNAALVEATNRGMEHETDYTSIHRLEHQSYQGLIDANDETSLMEGMTRGAVMQRVENGFTKRRVEISPEHQGAIHLDLWGNWLSDVARHEHAAAMMGPAGELMRALMRRGADGKTLGRMVKERFGTEAWKTLASFFNDSVNDDMRLVHGVLDNAARTLTQNMAISYLSGNYSPMLKQTASYPRFMIAAGLHRMLASTARFLGNMRGFLDQVYEMSPEVRDRKGDEMLKIIREDPAWGARRYQRFLDAASAPIGWIDRAVCAIGWDAVYHANLAELGHEGAAKEADRIVRLTQPVSSPRNKSRAWRQGGPLRVLMMFTGDANQTWGMSVYDLAQQLSSREWNGVKKGFLTMVVLTATACWIKLVGDVISGRFWDDDDDDERSFMADALTEQTLLSVPIIGKELAMWTDTKNGKYRRWQPSALSAPVTKLFNAFALWINGDEDKQGRALGDAAEALSLLGIAPMPVAGARRLFQLFDGEE